MRFIKSIEKFCLSKFYCIFLFCTQAVTHSDQIYGIPVHNDFVCTPSLILSHYKECYCYQPP